MKRILTSGLVAISAVALFTGCSIVGNLLNGGSEQRSGDGTKDVFSLAVGDCLNDQSADTVTEVLTVPCGAAHDNEVYYDFSLDSGDYPGLGAINAAAHEGCQAAFAAFVGIAYGDSVYDYTFFVPTKNSWNAGDYVVSCLIYDSNGPVVGTLAGIGR